MAKSKRLTATKAKTILHDKEVKGHPLTDKQRRFFGAVAGGEAPRADPAMGGLKRAARR